MRNEKTLLVNALWDDEAKVWVATSDDVPGLATEAENINELVKKLKIMVPELLDANGYADGDTDGAILVKILSECTIVTNRRKQKQRRAA
jgi:hypothetical protein